MTEQVKRWKVYEHPRDADEPGEYQDGCVEVPNGTFVTYEDYLATQVDKLGNPISDNVQTLREQVRQQQAALAEHAGVIDRLETTLASMEQQRDAALLREYNLQKQLLIPKE